MLSGENIVFLFILGLNTYPKTVDFCEKEGGLIHRSISFENHLECFFSSLEFMISSVKLY